MKIVYPDANSKAAALFEGSLTGRLDALGTFRLFPDKPRDETEFLSRIDNAEAIILGWGLPDAVLANAERLKVIAFTGIGASNHVNLDLATERGVTVCNTPGYADNTVAEHTLALMLAAAKRIPTLDAGIRAGGWADDRHATDLRDKTLGLVGLGGIGTRVAALARAFGMKVIAWTAHPSDARAKEAGVTFADLDTVFSDSDVVSLHLALTGATEGIVSKDLLGRMRPGAILINTARGELVDEPALIEIAGSGRISVALDVFHQEPLAADAPLRSMPNAVVTPHTGFATPDASLALFDLVVSAIEAFATGNPMHVVNPDVLSRRA